jgi:hypothetical protein
MQIMTLLVIKLVYTDICHYYSIPSNWTVRYAFLRIRDYIVEDFGVNNAFDFIHTDRIPHTYNDKPEEYSALTHTFLESTDKIRDHLYKKKLNAFYIRPIECNSFEVINGTIQRI